MQEVFSIQAIFSSEAISSIQVSQAVCASQTISSSLSHSECGVCIVLTFCPSLVSQFLTEDVG